ncbi:hypothetical protein [Limnohabitans sp. JirII-29]|uniref:hypothetical protein n=1 Tax=Limnohabitans sp. JirII-29 TaxID=1835756 RepID=UPI001304F4C2|nr:hypothetical protein [Limnohabitans sp. JirII-29]
MFIEIGTGSGGALEHACQTGPFEKLYSVEIHKESAEKVQAKFAHMPDVKIYNATSSEALRDIFKKLQASDKAFFFLDAHFPGEHGIDFSGYDNLTLNKVTLPLEDELEMIRDARAQSDDIIVIDDLRLYEQGPFERGNLPIGFGGIPEEMRNTDFVYRLFGDRTVIKDYRDEGYLIILPKKGDFELKRLGAFQRLKRNLHRKLNG